MKHSDQGFAIIAKEAASAASALIMEAFQNPSRTANEKSDGSYVTATDCAVQAAIIEILMKATPDFGLYAEESDAADRVRKDYTWIVDPVDGTHNFHYGIPCFASQIALEHNGRVVAAAMALPAEGLILHSWRGGGSYANGERLKVSNRPMRKGVLLLETRWSDADLQVAKAFRGEAHDIRVISSSCASLAYIALGRADMLIDWDDKPWDLAAGTLLVDEAGGATTDLSGGAFNVYEPRCIATNGVCHPDVLARVTASGAFSHLTNNLS